jgi:hypothetical protein
MASAVASATACSVMFCARASDTSHAGKQRACLPSTHCVSVLHAFMTPLRPHVMKLRALEPAHVRGISRLAYGSARHLELTVSQVQ